MMLKKSMVTMQTSLAFSLKSMNNEQLELGIGNLY
jgi:hypothetical protein